VVESIPNLRHLYALAEAARQGSISRAADNVHLSQSAVTQGIAGLEKLAGERLFDRTGSGIFPTEAGRRFVARIERAFQKLKVLQNEIDAGRAVRAEPLWRRMTSTQLRALIAVVENEGFSLAARELGRSQPSVFRSARDLERLCGHELFRRTANTVEPTAIARLMARCASLAFAEIRQGFEEIDELHGRMQGSVTVGCLPLARTSLLPTSITRFLSKHPSARVRVVDGPYDELLHALLHGKIDLIIGALRSPRPTNQIVQEALFDDPLSIVVRRGHPLLSRDLPDAAELAGLDWIVPREGTPARDHFNAFFAERHVEPPASLIECSSLVTTRGLLLQSDRAALLSVRQARLDVDSGQLATLSDPLPGTERTIGLTYRKDWQPTTVQHQFIEAVRCASKD
jgi:DNA-binding transcriptional LysR family regulator